MDKNWYAVYTKPGLETKVADILTKRKYENYNPLNIIQKERTDQKKIIYKPLFATFVFVRADKNQLTEIKNIGCIINFVYWLNKPAIIDHEEINTIKIFLNDYENIQVYKEDIKSINSVKMLTGSHVNQIGSGISDHEGMITSLLPSLGYIMKARIKKQNVKVIIKKNSDNYATIR